MRDVNQSVSEEKSMPTNLTVCIKVSTVDGVPLN